MTGMEIFNIVVGIASIGSFIVALLVKQEVRQIKNAFNTDNSTRTSGGQRIKGAGNVQAGGNIGK